MSLFERQATPHLPAGPYTLNDQFELLTEHTAPLRPPFHSFFSRYLVCSHKSADLKRAEPDADVIVVQDARVNRVFCILAFDDLAAERVRPVALAEPSPFLQLPTQGEHRSQRGPLGVINELRSQRT